MTRRLLTFVDLYGRNHVSSEHARRAPLARSSLLDCDDHLFNQTDSALACTVAIYIQAAEANLSMQVL